MHQHPRRSPANASPANSPRTKPTRTNTPQEGDNLPKKGAEKRLSGDQNSEAADTLLRGSGPSQQGSDATAKLNQIIQNYFTKAALTILNARVSLPPAFAKDSKTKRVNKWFNVEIDETDVLRDVLRPWRASDAVDERPPPMILETYIDAQELTNSQSLVFIDDDGKRWDVEDALNASPNSDGHSDGTRPEVILERWVIQLGTKPSQAPQSLATILPRTYKNSIVLFRSLFTCARLFPAWRLCRKLFTSRSSANTPKLRFRVSQDPALDPRAQQDNLTAELCPGQKDVVENHAFDPIDSPAGPFSIHVTYRTSCDFRLDDSEAFLSSQFMGMDAPFDHVSRHGSAPTHQFAETKKQNRPSVTDQSQAYGSMSTFHQLTGTGTSPISALRNVQYTSESPEENKTQRPSSGSKPPTRPGDVGRRPSVSFMPFKAPSLSASPSQQETGTSYPRGGSLGKSSPLAVLAEARHPSGPPRTSAEHSRTPSANSPKPAAPQRFSSSFGHRKAKLSTGGSKTEDDASSGKASASSPQPGSGILAEGGSSGSVHTDDDNISDFLKMLDQTKNLKSFKTSPQHSPSAAASRRTNAALSKFQQMRESNTALSESISSSQLVHRSSSSSSRQLASVPPMVAATSISTSSSPGKPISPHTPHTPAIPSRLSANSVADYTQARGERRSRFAEPVQPAPGAIDIPTSPRLFDPTYRRSSSAAQGDRTLPFTDDEGIFPFYMRSSSLDVDDRPPPSRSALIGLHEDPRNESAVANPSVENRPTFGPPLNPAYSAGGESLERQRSEEGQHGQSPYPSRRGLSYRPRLSSGRAETQPQDSSSSLAERGSRTSSEGMGRRARYSFSSQRDRPQSTYEDEEILLFAMSDLEAVQQQQQQQQQQRGSRGPSDDNQEAQSGGSREEEN